MIRQPPGLRAASLTVAALGLITACQKPRPPAASEQQKTAAAPSPAALSNYVPQRPYKPFSSGLLTQPVYVAESTGRHTIEVWDLMTGPGKKSEAATLPGAAVCEVRSGAGVITTAGKPRDVRTGTTFAINEGESFTIENRAPDTALMIRATIVRSRK
jgi:hypothetical protein